MKILARLTKRLRAWWAIRSQRWHQHECDLCGPYACQARFCRYQPDCPVCAEYDAMDRFWTAKGAR